MSKKVKFNIKNAHYAVMTRNASTGAISFGTPVAVPGSRSISIDPEGDNDPFWADGEKYFQDTSNYGYTADWELAYILDAMRKDLLQEVEDTAGVMYEVEENTTPVEFAFGFQIDGNEADTRFWFYCCTASRPGMEANTNEGSRKPDVDKLSLSMVGAAVKSGDDRKFVRAKCLSTATGDTYEDWFEAVVLPGTFGTVSSGGGSGSGT